MLNFLIIFTKKEKLTFVFFLNLNLILEVPLTRLLKQSINAVFAQIIFEISTEKFTYKGHSMQMST